MLIAPVDANLPQRNTGKFPKFPVHSTPVDRPHDGGKILVVCFLVKELTEHLFGPARGLIRAQGGALLDPEPPMR